MEPELAPNRLECIRPLQQTSSGFGTTAALLDCAQRCVPRSLPTREGFVVGVVVAVVPVLSKSYNESE